MHKTYASFLLISLLFLTACEEKKHESTPSSTQNISPHTSKKPKRIHDTFILRDKKDTSYTVTVSNQKVTFKESTKALTMVSFFATWCQPCLYDIPYLNDLQKKYDKDLLLASVLIHDTISSKDLNTFIQNNELNYYLSIAKDNNDFATFIAKTLHLPKVFSIPLTIIYLEGNYFTHYEGNVPIEMIEYDINQALQMLK